MKKSIWDHYKYAINLLPDPNERPVNTRIIVPVNEKPFLFTGPTKYLEFEFEIQRTQFGFIWVLILQ